MGEPRQKETLSTVIETLDQLFQTKSVKDLRQIKKYRSESKHTLVEKTLENVISQASEYLQRVFYLISQRKINFTKEQWETLLKVLDKYKKFDQAKEEKAETGKYNYNFMNQICTEACLCTFDLVDRSPEEENDILSLADLGRLRFAGIQFERADFMEKILGKTMTGKDYRSDIYTPASYLMYQITDEPELKDSFICYGNNYYILPHDADMEKIDPEQHWKEDFRGISAILSTAKEAIAWQKSFEFYASRKYLREYLHFQLQQTSDSKQEWDKTPPWEIREKLDFEVYKKYIAIEAKLYKIQTKRIIVWLTETESYLATHQDNELRKRQLQVVRNVLRKYREFPLQSLQTIWLAEEKTHALDLSKLLPPPGSTTDSFTSPHVKFLHIREAILSLGERPRVKAFTTQSAHFFLMGREYKGSQKDELKEVAVKHKKAG